MAFYVLYSQEPTYLKSTLGFISQACGSMTGYVGCTISFQADTSYGGVFISSTKLVTEKNVQNQNSHPLPLKNPPRQIPLLSVAKK